MDETDICIVKLQYGSYSSTETVYCDPNDDNEAVYRKAWKQALPDGGFLSNAYTSEKIVSREPYDGRFEN